ncbi:MAG: RNA-binding protein [Candidatus Lokiarchaeota archaeon]|nr:RNA-binding protein [Candidatus Lokiarchaeota archaeon]
MEHEQDESIEDSTTENNETEDGDGFDDEEASRDVVVPGEVLTEDTKNFLPGRGTIFNKDRTKIISLNIGLKQIQRNYINVIPLRGFYTPRPGDKIIALVTDKNPVKYRCDINAKEEGILKPKNTVNRGKPRGFRGGAPNDQDNSTEKYQIGDILIVKVLSADRLNSPELTTVGKYLGKRRDGLVISIDPPKIPRVIGRSGSMIKMLKNLTNCNIFVTQNGRIWLKGEDITHERLLIDAVKKIEKEAHTVGLTDRMSKYIENEKKKRGIN